MKEMAALGLKEKNYPEIWLAISTECVEESSLPSKDISAP